MNITEVRPTIISRLGDVGTKHTVDRICFLTGENGHKSLYIVFTNNTAISVNKLMKHPDSGITVDNQFHKFHDMNTKDVFNTLIANTIELTMDERKRPEPRLFKLQRI